MDIPVMIQLPSRQVFAQRLQHLAIGVAAASLAVLPVFSLSALAAEPCTQQCGTNQIRFMPGQPITIEFINRTDGTVNLERVLDIDMHWLRPQSEFAIETLVGVDDDMSGRI